MTAGLDPQHGALLEGSADMAKRTPNTAPKPDIEVLAPDAVIDPEQQQLTETAGGLTSFLGGLSTFFSGATQLEKKAKEQLDLANQLKMPTTAEEDEQVQVVIRASKLARKAIDDHWKITAVVHGLHRRLTAGRERGGLIADKAADIAQRHHNAWVEAENRRVREENDRLRREAEQREQRERDEEQARLEAEAVKAEEASPDLSEREQTFVTLVHSGVVAQHAAQRAGFKDALKTAARLMSNAKIIAALKAKADAETIRQQAAARASRPSTATFTPAQPQVSKAPGGFDRTTYSAEVFDVDAFMAALLDPTTRVRLGIPADIATFLQPKLNEHAKDLKELINKWPGVRAVKKTTTV